MGLVEILMLVFSFFTCFFNDKVALYAPIAKRQNAHQLLVPSFPDTSRALIKGVIFSFSNLKGSSWSAKVISLVHKYILLFRRIKSTTMKHEYEQRRVLVLYRSDRT